MKGFFKLFSQIRSRNQNVIEFRRVKELTPRPLFYLKKHLINSHMYTEYEKNPEII